MNLKALTRLLSYSRDYTRTFALGALVVVAGSLIGLTRPWLLKHIIDDALKHHDFGKLRYLIIALANLTILRCAVEIFRARILQSMAMRILADLRIQLFTHIQRLPIQYFDTNGTGKIVARITQDANELYSLLNGYIVDFLADAITTAIALVFLFCVQWRLGLAVTLILPFYFLNIHVSNRKLRAENQARLLHWDEIVAFLHERIAAVRLVKSLSKEAIEASRFREKVGIDMKRGIYTMLQGTYSSAIADTLGSFAGLIVLGYGGSAVIAGGMELGTVIAAAAYVAVIFPPMHRFVNMIPSLQRTSIALENIWTILDLPCESQDKPGAISMDVMHGNVEFRGVYFNYNRITGSLADQFVLSDFNISIAAGSTVAIVGPSGSAKTTILNLIAKFYEIERGQLLIDGCDINRLNSESLRRHIGIVLQENLLFSGSLSDNIRYGRDDATFDEIQAAAVAANAHEFILKRSGGYSNIVGERGAGLSGGERQRIAIARMFLRNPKIVMFDEATNALDAESERLVRESMTVLFRGRTVFIIAHRFSTIKHADIILVMNNGRIAERGNHATLIAAGGLYAKMYDDCDI